MANETLEGIYPILKAAHFVLKYAAENGLEEEKLRHPPYWEHSKAMPLELIQDSDLNLMERILAFEVKMPKKSSRKPKERKKIIFKAWLRYLASQEDTLRANKRKLPDFFRQLEIEMEPGNGESTDHGKLSVDMVVEAIRAKSEFQFRGKMDSGPSKIPHEYDDYAFLGRL